MLTRNAGADAAADDPYLVASASSDGIIRVWDVRMALKEKPNPLAEANTKSRITCLAGSSLKCKFVTVLFPSRQSFHMDVKKVPRVFKREHIIHL